MSLLALRVLEHVHGHLGWLTVIALVHPAILLRRPARRAPLAALLATLLVTLTASLGAATYPSYSTLLKQALFKETPTIGWMFERKEHLAIGVLAFAWVGLVAHLWAPRLEGEARVRLATLAWRAYAIAATFAALVAGIGTLVAVTTSF